MSDTSPNFQNPVQAFLQETGAVVREGPPPVPAPALGPPVAPTLIASVRAPIYHTNLPELPSLAPAFASDAIGVVFQFRVTLPVGDTRVAGMDLLMERIRELLRGDLRPTYASQAVYSPTRLVKGRLPGAPRPSVGSVNAAHARDTGRYAKPRFGTVRRRGRLDQTAAKGGEGTSWAFHSMADLAGVIGCPYSSVSQKYNNTCRSLGVHPDDHEGVQFSHAKFDIFLSVR